MSLALRRSTRLRPIAHRAVSPGAAGDLSLLGWRRKS
jgi:hypothetical protein